MPKPASPNDHPSEADPLCILAPPTPTPGMWSALARLSKQGEIKNYEANRERRVWRVRGVVSDHISLIGDASIIERQQSFNQLRLNQNPLTIYLHAGGRNAIYFDLV